MKFSCDSCSAQYKIGDDKLGRRGVKVRCKRCGSMIVVRPGVEVGAESTASARPKAMAATAGDGLAQEFSALGFDEAGRGGGSIDLLTQSAPAGDAATTQVVTKRAVPGTLEDDLELSRSEPTGPDGAEQGLGPAKAAESHPSVTAQSPSEAVFADREAHGDSPTAAAGAPNTAAVPATGPDPVTSTAAERAGFDELSRDLGGVTGRSPGPGDVRVEPFGGEDDALNPAKLESELRDEAWSEAPPAPAWTHGGPDEDPWAIGGATWSPSFDESEVRDDGDRAEGEAAGPDPMSSTEVMSTEDPAAASPAPPTEARLEAVPPAPLPSDDLGDAETSVEAEIGHAFAAMFDAEASPEPPLDGPAASVEPEAPQPPPLTVAPSSVEAEWYVAVAEEQVGPLTRREVEAKWASGTIDAESLCWKQGRPDWAPIGDVAELADLVVQPSAKPSASSSAFGRGLTGEIAPAIALANAGEGAPAAAGPGPQTTDGWRPSAASALASLAAEELAEPEPVRPSEPESERRAKPTTGRMTALPTANGELSRLIEGHGRAEGTASMFGLAEKSVSKVRAIPRRAETLAAGPLADVKTPPDRRRKLLIGAAVLGGVLVAGGAGAALFSGSGADDPSPDRPVAEAAPTATEKRPGPAAALGSSPSKAPPVGDESAPPARPSSPSAAASKQPPTEPIGALAAVRGPDPTPSAAPPKPDSSPPAITPLAASSLRSTVDSADAPSPSKATPKRAKPNPVKKKKKRRAASRKRARRSSRPDRAAARPAPKKVAAPAGGVDDLLAAAGKPRSRRRPKAKTKPQLPTKLDETEVFRVLRRHKTQVRDCITQHQEADGPKGRVRVSLDIRPTGRVAGTKLSPSRFAGSVLGRCLSGHARSWKFPRFKGSTTPVDFPVTVK